MTRDEFREALLTVMENKVHWAWPSFLSGAVPADRLHLHLEAEFEVYVRDFPLFLGRAYAQCPIPEVRRDLAENLYEEETGGLHAGRPHPELFLEFPRGLGMDLSRFGSVPLLPAAARYRAWLDEATTRQGWDVATAVATIFVEGTKDDRCVLDPSVPMPLVRPLAEHPLVVHYGLPVERLALTRAHRGVEGEHRVAAWRMVLDYVAGDRRGAVVQAMETTLERWLAYRDEVAASVGLSG